jgi:GTP-binding protein YchF
MKTAIIGLPMTGKTSLFTILTGVHEATRMGQMEARLGVTKVPDPRLEALAKIFQPPKITQAVVEYLDYPSISKEALQNASYLGGLRTADSLAHVLRVFDSDTVPHEKGSVDALRDAADVETELILSDLVVVEKRIERLEKDRKKQRSADLDKEFELLEQAKALLEDNRPLRELTLDAESEKRLRGFQFLSQKSMLYVLNLGEEDAPRLKEVEEQYRGGPLGQRPNTGIAAVCGKVEAELAELSPDESRELLASYGLNHSGLQRLIEATYRLQGLMSFLTAGDTEVRAWTIPVGSKAPQAAGAIHTDIEKKFIRAEVVNWRLLVDHDGYPGLKEKGLLRLEGKEYVVQDGDVMVIRHG